MWNPEIMYTDLFHACVISRFCYWLAKDYYEDTRHDRAMLELVELEV